MAQANFISYKNSPIYLGTQEGQVPATGLAGVNNLIAVNSCEISFEAQLEPQKFLGKQPIANDFTVSAPQQARISLTYTPLVGNNLVSGIQDASLVPLSLTGDSVSGNSIRVGNLLFQKCYLDSLGVQVSAWNSIKFSTQFTSYDITNLENATYSGIEHSGPALVNPLSGSYFSSLHALSLGVSGESFSIPESKTEINIQTTCARTPIYEVGSITPTTVILNSVQRTASINGENIGRVINFSGANASLSLRFSEFSKMMESGFNPMTDYRFSIDTTGKVSSQSLSMQPNRTIDGSVNIVSNIY